MRKTLLIVVHLIVVFIFVSCKKNDDQVFATATTLNIINAVPATSGLIPDINTQLPYYLGQPAVSYGGSNRYTFAGGNTNIILRDNIDTTTNVFTQNIILAPNSVHSLFLTGSSGSVESVLTIDTLPYHGPQGHGAVDSVVGIRFINLSIGSEPVSVNIIGNLSGSEITDLPYKTITRFKNYAATSAIDSYTFEFRDPATDNVLASYTLYGVNDGVNGNGAFNSVLFKNITIALIGEPGSQSTMQVNNF